MLTRIATWSLGALVALSMATSAQAAPSKLKPTAKPVPAKKAAPDPFAAIKRPASPQYRRMPIRATAQKPAVLSEARYDQGRIEKIDDGAVIYSVEIPPELRQSLARKQNKPLSQVPDRVMRRALIDYRSTTPSLIRNRIGDEVRIELRQDGAGYLFVTNLLSPKTK